MKNFYFYFYIFNILIGRGIIFIKNRLPYFISKKNDLKNIKEAIDYLMRKLDLKKIFIELK